MLLPFPYSAGQEEILAEENILVDFLKSRVVAVFLILIALLQPIESIAANCQNESMLCTDSTPCKQINGVTVCLSTVNPLPTGAVQSTQPCWNSTGTYQCLDVTAPLTDTCTALANNQSCGKINSTCILTDPTTGVCTSYTDTYSCQTGGGVTTTTTDCSGQTYCIDGTCYTKKDGPNGALAKAVTAMEVSRMAGFYMDPATQKVFSGEQSWCSQDALGLANCCKPNSAGASSTDALIVEYLISKGMNSWAKSVAGSSYSFDSLFSQASGFVTEEVAGIQQVLDGNIIAGGKSMFAAATPVPVNQPVAGASSGGMVGGMIGQQLGTMVGSSLSNNIGVQGTFGAVGYAAGTIGGTYVGAGAYYLAATGGNVAAAGAYANAAVVDICVPCLIAVVFIMIIMAFLACSAPEIQTAMKLGAPGLCHYVGSYCSTKIPLIGTCITTRQEYCCFNSQLAELIQVQGRPQIGRGWGAPESPDCSGLTVNQLGQLDFSKIDLSSFFNQVVAQATTTTAQLTATATANATTYFSAAAANPTATFGVVPLPTAGVPVTATITTSYPAVTTMPACNNVTSKSPMAANGDQSGSVAITSCLPNGIAAFVYTGSCPTLQTNVVTDVPLDTTGAGVYSAFVPSACSTSLNIWTARIIDPPSGNIPGSITVTW